MPYQRPIIQIQSLTAVFRNDRQIFLQSTGVQIAGNHLIQLLVKSLQRKNRFPASLTARHQAAAIHAKDGRFRYCDVDTGTYEYDVEKAKQILEDAGWVDSDGDGIREKDGVKLSGNLLYATDQASLGDLSSVLAAQLKEVGFEITPVGKEQMVYFQDISNGDFDLAIAITNAIPSDPYLLISRCLTNTVIDNYLAQGLAGMENADELINSLNAMTNEDEIQSVYNTLLQELHDEATIIPLTRVKGMVAYDTNVISSYEFYNQPDYTDVSAIIMK